MILNLGELSILFISRKISIAPCHKIIDKTIKIFPVFVITSATIRQEHKLHVKTVFFCITARVIL